MKIYLTTPGDPSVGLQGDDIQIEWNWNLDELAETHEKGREGLRQDLAAFFGQFTDGTPRVGFEDECEECGRILDQDAGHLCRNCLNSAVDNVMEWLGEDAYPNEPTDAEAQAMIAELNSEVQKR